MSDILAVTDLSAGYGEAPVIHDVSFRVAEREIVTLVGANGAGKSTTMAAICGLLRSAPGSIVFRGEDASTWPAERRCRAGISLTPEGRRVFAELTVAENLALGGAMLDRLRFDRQLERQLELFPILQSRYRQKAGSLSGGEQQMLAIARSLMSAPRLLLLDEPSLGLAPRIVDELFGMIESLRQAGLSILLVEQNVALAVEIADRALLMTSGRIVHSGPASTFATSDVARQVYFGV